MATQFDYPTPVHRAAAETIVAFFQERTQVDAILLVNSCARGRALPESDLDIAVLVAPQMSDLGRGVLEQQWQQFYANDTVFHELKQCGRFCGVHLDLFDGGYTPERWDDGGGPDDFEIAIGNQIVHSAPLWEGSAAFAHLKAAWLPYYNDTLWKERREMARAACLYDLEFVPFYVERGLYFQAFDRLYKAFREFLQALFIAHHTYPIAYNKWIREQVVEWLGLPELYERLPAVLEITALESPEMITKAQLLRELVDTELRF